MSFREQDLAAIRTLGYTTEEAQFLYLVAVHSGYFVPRQFVTFTGIKWGKRLSKFLAKLESRGHVTWREYDRTGGVYHLFSKTLYRLIEKENLRNWRRHSVEFIRTRLVLFDFVLANLPFEYLETEPEKVAFFCDALSIPRELLPAKRYDGSAHSQPTLRYFVDKFPLHLERAADCSLTVHFSYVDAGQARLTGFANHLRAYLPLLCQLQAFSFLYIANSPVHFIAAEKCFRTLVEAPLESHVSRAIVRYFRLRQAWDQKEYGSLSTEDIEWLKEATRRFQGDRIEQAYLAWASGALTEQMLRAEFAESRPPRVYRFATYLVAPVPLARRGRPEDGGDGLYPSSSIVKKPPESVTRSLSLEKPVSKLLDDYSRFVDCTPDYVANFALKRMLSRDREYKKWNAASEGAKPASPAGPGKNA